ncbi:MAG: hypothetical protein EA339_00525 [Rhodobacteraceae bacterium]|nr:MAG: hypothetical protein EA339_00525 [Paracoccaceae bacterium]
MRPLEPQDDDAPLLDPAGRPSFWDHLGATRAEEYAQDDILPDVPVTLLPVSDTGTQMRAMPGVSPADCHRASLDDTLQAMGGDLILPSSESDRAQILDPAASAAALGAGLGQALSTEQMARFVDMSMPHPSPNPRRRARMRFREGRLGYRLQRIWLTPIYRRMLKYGLPVVCALSVAALYFSNEANREAVVAHYDAAYASIVDRPEFMVTTFAWPDVTPELDLALRAMLEPQLPKSSFRLDLDALRREVEALDWVRSADLRLLADGVLGLTIHERRPVVLWRSENGLELLDAEGIRVAYVLSREYRPDLPLIAGAGANTEIREALDLLEAATPLGPRALGLVRMGERRWDVVLDRGQRIKLPETGALAALERVIALEQAQDLLSRDLITADLRNPSRPVLQLSPGAMDTLREIRAQSTETVR